MKSLQQCLEKYGYENIANIEIAVAEWLKTHFKPTQLFSGEDERLRDLTAERNAFILELLKALKAE